MARCPECAQIVSVATDTRPWCHKPLPENVRAELQRERAIRAADPLTDLPQDKPMAIFDMMKFAAWAILAGSVILAIMVWVDIGSRPRFAGSSSTELPPLGVAIGGLILIAEIVACVLLLLLLIADDLKAMRGSGKA
jgi:hypothetical protein